MFSLARITPVLAKSMERMIISVPTPGSKISHPLIVSHYSLCLF